MKLGQLRKSKLLLSTEEKQRYLVTSLCGPLDTPHLGNLKLASTSKTPLNRNCCTCATAHSLGGLLLSCHDTSHVGICVSAVSSRLRDQPPHLLTQLGLDFNRATSYTQHFLCSCGILI